MSEDKLLHSIESNRGTLFGLLLGKGYSHEEAEDAIQTLYLELLPNLEGLQTVTPAFLKTRVLWIANRYKTNSHDKQNTDLEDFDQAINPTIEMEHDVQSAIEHLPTQEMRDLARGVYEGNSLQEIANAVSIPRYKIDALWQETKEQLKKFLKGYGCLKV